MKLLIASDIHGDVSALETLLLRYRVEKADRLLLLGDLLYHGPRNNPPSHYAPKEVIAHLNSLRDEILAVRGNCDAEVDAMVLDFPTMADYAYLMLDSGTALFATHGHLYDRDELYLRKNEHYIQGHTHVPMLRRDGNGHLFLNPGSISLPKENNPPTYITYENGIFALKTLSGAILQTENGEFLV